MATTPQTAHSTAQANFQHVDRPDLAETFADHVRLVIFDGSTLRLELGVTRLDELKPQAPPSGRRYPSCRLVLTPGAAVDLINQLQRIAAGLVQAGILKADQQPAPAAGAEGAPKTKN
jgi:hypothetical protein